MHEEIAHSEGKGLRPLVKFAHDILQLYDDSHFITDKRHAYNAFAAHFADIMRNEGLDVDAPRLKKLIVEYGKGGFGSYLADYFNK